MQIKVEVSARHIHLTRPDVDILFGKGHQLKSVRKLSQADDFASEETVLLRTEKEEFKLRVVGPTRTYSQIEISKTDAIRLDINPPIKISGDVDGVDVYDVEGPLGKVRVPVIIAKRHLHVSSKEAEDLKLKNRDIVKINIIGERGLILDNVMVRVAENYHLACHIDTDEANACGFGKICGEGELLQ